MSTYSVTPAELGQFLDAVASAPVALCDVPRINSILARLVGLANSTSPIGAIGPAGPGTIGVVPTEPSSRDPAALAALMTRE